MKNSGTSALVVGLLVGVGIIVGGISLINSGTGAVLGEQAIAVEVPDGKVVLTEFSDYECPACGVWSAYVKELQAEFGDALILDYRHFPLSYHKNAQMAAEAAEAARAQGSFWEMHDLLFEKNSAGELDSSKKVYTELDFVSLAEELDLDVTKFAVELKDDKYTDIVQEQYREGTQAGVNATPSFFVNGQKVDFSRLGTTSAQEYLHKSIQDALEGA